MPARMQILGKIHIDQVLKADRNKIDNILTCPRPGNNKQLQRFLGMVNYVRQFCPQLGTVAAPLSELRVATTHWKWTDMHDVLFEEVPALIMCNKVL